MQDDRVLSVADARIDPPDLTLDACRVRLARLRESLDVSGVDAAVIDAPDVVRWAVGTTSLHGWPAALIVTHDRAIALLFGGDERASIASEQRILPGISRHRAIGHHEELREAAQPWLDELGRSARAVGIDSPAAPGWIMSGLASAGVERTIDIASLLRRLRRHKEADELAIVEHNVTLSLAAFRAARASIHPGTTELDVFLVMTTAVLEAAGTSVAFGGDFMSGPGGGEHGGPPSARVLTAGDSYVVDFFPHHGGYWSDMCRTYPVGEPSGDLASALEATSEALQMAEDMIRPGLPVAELDRTMRAHLSVWRPCAGEYFHLSGHGIGMRPHEAPWIVDASEEVFEVGDVIAVEPGTYLPELRGGVRIEDDFQVVDGGVRRLGDLARVPEG